MFALSNQNNTIMENQTRGLRNKNPFNIRKSKSRWLGKIKGTDKDFETFDTLAHGYRAGLKLLLTYYKKYKLHSYGTILNRFAPSFENNLDEYKSYLFLKSGVLSDEYISLRFLLWHVAPYIARFESDFVDDDIVFKVTSEFCKNYSI